ncbi:MAG: aminotransferase class I/II-fold pyridoxal phosphate-dependent enzyme [Deltaproteobacteria bacterium]|nr:MAG: aminotransferase class I/II-fold pyridoxal phosphate-dependent enzyme [Deltaproteobacteria bacterium]
MTGRGRGIGTLAVHGGEPAVRGSRTITEPLVLSSTFPFEDTAELEAFMRGEIERPHEYGRYGNPTVAALEAKVAALEGMEAARAFASGMAAVTTTLLGFLRPGQHAVFTADVYRKTRLFAVGFLSRYGVDVDLVEPTAEAVEDALRDETRLVFTELPTNPYLRVPDLPRIVEVAHGRRAKVVLDATFATPVNLRAVDHGVDLVVHSTTKYLAGHNDVLGGVVCGKRGVVEAIGELQGTLGAIVDPHAAYLTLRGIKTLELRVRRQNETALALARLLDAHPAIARVHYPMLDGHPDHAVATRLLAGGGGVVSFEFEGGLRAATRFVDALEIPKLAPSLGGVESLVEQPPLMSFFDLGPEGRAALGISEGLVRYAVGIEDTEDLLDDVRCALDRLG